MWHTLISSTVPSLSSAQIKSSNLNGLVISISIPPEKFDKAPLNAIPSPIPADIITAVIAVTSIPIWLANTITTNIFNATRTMLLIVFKTVLSACLSAFFLLSRLVILRDIKSMIMKDIINTTIAITIFIPVFSSQTFVLFHNSSQNSPPISSPPISLFNSPSIVRPRFLFDKYIHYFNRKVKLYNQLSASSISPLKKTPL